MDTLSLSEWISVAAVFAAAGLLRGFTGFGFALVAVPFGALWLPPDIIIPVVFLLHVYIGLFEVPRVARSCRAGALIWVMAGAAAGTPIGVLALVVMPARAVHLVIGAIVVVSLVPLLLQPARRHLPAGGRGRRRDSWRESSTAWPQCLVRRRSIISCAAGSPMPRRALPASFSSFPPRCARLPRRFSWACFAGRRL
ncbi:sulfite exporter TauE/SafE family protein [Xanthobacter sp. KR7-225]|uniref:sulfite exporter TauE/SafE family protein n=1 Tax=Xanthobacter sp. KR7-225 TaxID=3156613 RepID=UPI0032B5FEFD